jgi:hypothetical protein
MTPFLDNHYEYQKIRPLDGNGIVKPAQEKKAPGRPEPYLFSW